LDRAPLAPDPPWSSSIMHMDFIRVWYNSSSEFALRPLSR
jgi:hypothetical protein